MPKALDITGQRFGSLIALKKASSRNGKTYWLCQCDCGQQKEIQTSHLTNGTIKSCGCQKNILANNTIKEKSLTQTKICEICGKPFNVQAYGTLRKYCYDCSPYENENCSHAQAISIKRKAIKKALIMRKGGRCERCGYDRCMRALEFHHLDPTQKDFGISKTITKSFSNLVKETDKCILLCANCHAEEHQRLSDNGYIEIE